ncbi:MAG: metallophosphoesterase family protein [Candidatus Hydrogenedentes bacterium]|nr:metallophosphoesterase family protein [Candidatus Hydrogenedentota bacterium]
MIFYRLMKTWGVPGVCLSCCVLLICAVSFGLEDQDPGTGSAQPYFNRPYLTWQGDPSTTITINFHTAQAPVPAAVCYGTEGDPGACNMQAEGQSRQIPGLADGRFVNSVELTGLKPGQAYYFNLVGVGEPGKTYAFSTLPDTGAPLRFAIGGDTLATGIFDRLLGHVAARSPRFVVIGGDLAYANGDVNQVERWNSWFKFWHQHDTTPEGMLIPLVMAIGNHETNDLEGSEEERAPFYFGFFPQGGKTYFSRRFGANLGMIVLDSGHLVAPEAQVGWLEERLKEFAELPFRAAVYHVPLYPSHRDFNDGRSVDERTFWLPLFDAYSLSVGFEHHDHDFKRSKRLRNNAVDPEGTLYLGDGNAGVMPRKPNPGLWYLEKTGRESHFWIVDVTTEEMRFNAVNIRGDVFDETAVMAGTLVEK